MAPDSKVEPMIALPFHPSNAYTIKEFLANAEEILKGVEEDARRRFPKADPHLTDKIHDGGVWADQGVMLLNTVLTVRAHAANSHKNIGWEEFTDAAIRVLNEQDRPMVFILWGRPAQRKKEMIHNPKHLVLMSAHPSPLSAYRGFFGSHPFSRTNEYLEENGLAPIDWQIDNVIRGAKE